MMEERNYFAIGLSVEGKRAVVIGGGQLAEHRVRLLLDCKARVAVVSPDLTAQLQRQVEAGAIEWTPRRYQAGDLEGAALVLATTNRRQTNAAIYRDARAAGVLANIADDVPHCDFILPAVVRRGFVQLFIHTNGKLPALSGWMRRKLESLLPADLGERAAELELLRPIVAAAHPEMEQRRKVWNEILESRLPHF